MTVDDVKAEALRLNRGVGGWCSQEQGEFLFDLVMGTDPAHDVLEMGSFKGKSAIWMGKALQLQGTPTRMLHCVDAFLGEDAIGCLGQRRCVMVCKCDPNHADRGPTYDSFLRNVAKAGVEPVIQIHKGWSVDMAKAFSGTLSLLYIDGGHRYQEVRQDVDYWSPFLVPGGIMAFDDSDTHKGVMKVMAEIQATGQWERIGAGDHATAWRFTG